ncbi:transporter YjgP/YjgQ [Acetobacter aceti NRIC 0242]|uniref:LPS export ABC transporter permease LptG n=1 Tax=Acetobacter aceti NBRC 14818 TaxID=887700 RepID=A0AB33I8X3_ACEAC|nr:LPS export ABC transporter permease LptG [Acetobacter aceti]TCS32820.1 lipopolysaccharide export system permease protein [Acetobacter aceti NBRC 14818]BCK74767.1 LPS export ABC transporter permease LptG [Acetobacter aceti NBRC 14818]GAN58062.1 transporter YjgP/YjgQ [Acetobacter aceti NBRC 14818]GBO81010.1 transporter YjgP/YjgQ [Acetobacter aceti NRIC 0242]
MLFTTVPVTLSIYIARQFMFSVLSMTAFLTGIVCLFDFIDLLRRVATKTDVPTSLVTEIAGLHIPYFFMEIMPFGVLLGGIICFWRLTRSSELIVARAAGISAWQFLAAPLACALAMGALTTAAVSPLSSIMYARAEALDEQYLRSGGGPLTMAGASLWLRQLDTELDPHGVAILHSRDTHLDGALLTIHDISVFRLDHEGNLIFRIEAPAGHLAPGHWELDNASELHPYELPGATRIITLPTDLTLNRVQESFASPETLSVWALPNFIAMLDRSGFSSIRHRLHFESLLALPILAGTMSLVAAGFSMRPTRRGGVAKMIGSGVGAGFLLFTVSKVAEQFGNSGALPPLLAAWAPTGAGLCLAVSLLLHLEDG